MIVWFNGARRQLKKDEYIMIKIRITDNHGSYVEVFDDGELIETSEQVGSSIDADSETLLSDLAEEFPGADISDER